MTNWIEVILQVDGEAAEAVAELLHRYSYQGVSIEQNGIKPDVWDEDELPAPKKLTVRAYFPQDEQHEKLRFQLETALGHMHMMYPMPTPVYNIVKEEDWENAWKKHYKPVRISKRLLIRPQWIEITPDETDIVISLDPGMAFGTGTHPTTQLCLEAIEERMQPGYRVLDLGCGSGILSIAAAKLGADHVLGLDIDPLAVDASIENIENNGVSGNVTIQRGSLENVIGSARRFDLVVVNILAKIILKMCENHLGDTVRPGGNAIFSGIIDTQVDEVTDALQATGLTVINQRQMGDWVLLETIRKPND